MCVRDSERERLPFDRNMHAAKWAHESMNVEAREMDRNWSEPSFCVRSSGKQRSTACVKTLFSLRYHPRRQLMLQCLTFFEYTHIWCVRLFCFHTCVLHTNYSTFICLMHTSSKYVEIFFHHSEHTWLCAGIWMLKSLFSHLVTHLLYVILLRLRFLNLLKWACLSWTSYAVKTVILSFCTTFSTSHATSSH